MKSLLLTALVAALLSACGGGGGGGGDSRSDELAGTVPQRDSAVGGNPADGNAPDAPDAPDAPEAPDAPAKDPVTGVPIIDNPAEPTAVVAVKAWRIALPDGQLVTTDASGLGKSVYCALMSRTFEIAPLASEAQCDESFPGIAVNQTSPGSPPIVNPEPRDGCLFAPNESELQCTYLYVSNPIDRDEYYEGSSYYEETSVLPATLCPADKPYQWDSSNMTACLDWQEVGLNVLARDPDARISPYIEYHPY